VRVSDSSQLEEVQTTFRNFNAMVGQLNSISTLSNDFVANVSHEFKTPLSTIEGYAMLLQDPSLNEEERQDCIEKILTQTQRLTTLVGNILLLSKIESKELADQYSTFRLDEQIRQSIVALESAWVAKDIELDVELQRVSYLGNEPMMRHVWDNLISNAIKFSPPGGRVSLRLIREQDKLIFTVEDQGPGLSPESQKHIFDKFYQADTSHKQEGNGLGLALTKRILAIEKGHVVSENIPEGGCRFTVTLSVRE
jgi:signal transduction histidine kinase